MTDYGPLQLLTVGFSGNRFRGEILPELDRLKGRRLIRVLDMLVVRKDPQGRVMVMTASDLDFEEAGTFGAYLGEHAGLEAGGESGRDAGAIAGAAALADGHLFDEDDVFSLTQALPNDATAALLLIEHLWAKPLLGAVERAGGFELMNEWVKPDDLVGVTFRAKAEREPPAD
jgi:uncharacterized membrane protein